MSLVRRRGLVGRCLLGAGLAVLLAAAPLAAQEAAPQMILVHTETVKPPLLDQYVQSSKAFFDHVRSHRETMPTFSAAAFQTDEYEFIYAMPLASFAQMDTVMGEFMAMQAAGGEAWEEMMKAGAATTVKQDESIVLFRTDLSYLPDEARVPMEQAAVYRWDYYYLQPEMYAEAEQIARDVAALYREKGIKDAYGVFQAVLGSDLPYMIVSTPGKSLADIASRMAEAEATLGEAWPPIQARIDAATRAFVTKNVRVRPDLSLQPPAPADGE